MRFPSHARSIAPNTPIMSDTEMDGGIALASPTHSQLADKINGGAMDVSRANGAASLAESTVTSRLYVLAARVCLPG